MRLVLFKIFGVKIFGYGTMIAIGICAALILVSYRGKKRGYDEDSLLNMSILAIIMGILGGKLLYIITELSSIIYDPSLLMDVGSGFGNDANFVYDEGFRNIWGIDIDEEAVKYAGERYPEINFKKGDALKVNDLFEEEFFDFVYLQRHCICY